MFSMSKDWNPRQAALKEALSNPDHFDKAIGLCRELHGIVHSAQVTLSKRPTLFDELLDGLTQETFSTMLTAKDATIAWNIWHITRIEDITANILIADGKQVLNNTWLKKLGVTVRDTGNAMNRDEIMNLSNSLNMKTLRQYRDAVGLRTQAIVKNLSPQNLKRKVKPESVNRILAEGGVIEHKDSIWLLEFWGKKNIAGILLMPITRHQIIHVNDSMNLKKKALKKV
jgi:hypothetical protein